MKTTITETSRVVKVSSDTLQKDASRLWLRLSNEGRNSNGQWTDGRILFSDFLTVLGTLVTGEIHWGDITGNINDQTDLCTLILNLIAANPAPPNPFDENIDGGNASSVYLTSQLIDGGSAYG